MKHPPHSMLHGVFAGQSARAGKPAPSDWMTAFLEALYEMQRHQALGVIRAYQGFLGLPSDETEKVNAAAKDRGDDAR